MSIIKYTIDIPETAIPELEELMKKHGAHFDRRRQVTAINDIFMESSTAMGHHTGDLAAGINRRLEKLGLEPRIPTGHGAWGPERIQEFLKMAVNSFQWEGSEVQEDHWKEDGGTWQQVREEYPLVFGGREKERGGAGPEVLRDERGEPVPLTGPIDTGAIFLGYGHQGVRSNRMTLAETVAYISGQEHNSYPGGVDHMLNDLAEEMNHMLDDGPRQLLMPLAAEMVHTYCWPCGQTRMETLTRITASETLPELFRREGLEEQARALEQAAGEDISTLLPTLDSAAAQNSLRKHSPAGSHAGRMSRVIRALTASGKPGGAERAGRTPDMEVSLANIAVLKSAGTGRSQEEQEETARRMVDQMRRVIRACAHAPCGCGHPVCRSRRELRAAEETPQLPDEDSIRRTGE